MSESGAAPGAELTADERGETVPRWARVVVRLLAVAIFLGGTLAVALVRRDDADENPSDAGSTATPSHSPQSPDRAERVAAAQAARQVRLLGAEDSRLRAASSGAAVGATRIAGTVVLGARRSAYTLEDLVRAGAATRVSRSVVLVTKPVTVRRDARLVIDAPGTTLRLRSDPDGFASLVAWGGSIALVGGERAPLVLEGWNAERDEPDNVTNDGRAYIRVKDGELRLGHADVRHLGFWSGRTGGLSLTGTSDTTASGSLDDVTIRGLHLGLYLSGARHVRLRDVRVLKPKRHGIEVTNQSERVRIDGLVVRDAHEDAVSVSNGSAHVDIADATLSGADGYGLDVDGSPLADGPNSAGYGIGNYGSVAVTGSEVTDNRAGGLRFQSVDHVEVIDTRVKAQRSAIVVRGAAEDVVLSGVQASSSDGTGIVLADGVRGASVRASTVTGLQIGVDVEDSTAAVADNEISVGTGHGIRVAGHDAEATVDANTIHGRGSSAVDAQGGASIDGSRDSAGRWTYRPEVFMWAERNSAAMPLLLVLVVPAIGLVFVLRRRRQQRQLRRAFEETLIARGQSAIASYRLQPVTPSEVSQDLPGVDIEQADIEPADIEQADIQRADIQRADIEQAVAEDSALSTATLSPDQDRRAPENVPARRSGPAALEGREFEDARSFAVAAVIEAGYPPSMVARVLHVPTSRVRAWVEARPEPTQSPGE